jgi:hypothetical protein
MRKHLIGHAFFHGDSYIVLSDFYMAFDKWEAPIYSMGEQIVTSQVAEEWLKVNFYAPVFEGCLFLRKWFEADLARETPSKVSNEQRDTNTLLKLPLELRTINFEMVFAFKWPGLIVRRGEFRLFKRMSDGPSRLDVDNHTLRAPPIPSILALLSVNRAKYREALLGF